MNVDYVNCLIGTCNSEHYSNGNVYPITSIPFGMANFTVQTSRDRYAWFFSPFDKTFEGIRLTHQASPWVNDYGHILLFPYVGKLNECKGDRLSSFSNDSKEYKPYMLDLFLKRFQMEVKLVPTIRGAIIKLKSRNNEKVCFAIEPYADSSFSVNETNITGYTDAQFEWGFERIREYFYIETNSNICHEQRLENGGIALEFDNCEVEIKLSISFISCEQAKINYLNELKSFTFGDLLQKAIEEWDNLLSKINVKTNDEELKKTFYSSLYRVFLYPNVFYEENKDGVFHFNADLNEIKPGYFYTNNGFWDTYRTVYSLFNILIPKKEKEMLEGFINFGEETGFLPKWIAPGEIGIMPGSLIESVIASAAINKVIDSTLLERAYKLLLKNAFVDAKEPWKQGRKYLSDYIKYGYVPYTKNESINNTLDNAYGDFCIAQVSKLLGDEKTYLCLMERSKNYKHLFDSSTMFFRGKDTKGNFKSEFSSIEWGGDNCECSSWQNAFSVYHDINGLINLYGTKMNFEKKLDELFNMDSVFEVGKYGKEIHEMSEMAAYNLGQCAISNQPSFHIPWLYSYIGKKDKTIQYVHRIINEMFDSSVTGFPGDEDNGSMAAFYVFACLGFYPVCPSKNEFALSKTVFEDVEINNKKLSIPENLDIGKLEDILQ